jgi:hypothetical protein
MPELLETLETIQAAEASVTRLFASREDGGGRPVRSLRRSQDPAYVQSLAECATFLQEVLTGRRPSYHLQEAMTTSDFPILFSDILDRQVLADYQQAEPVWRSFARTSRVRDFREVKRYTVDGGMGLLPEVPEKNEYPEDSIPDLAPFTYRVTKKGKRFQLTWETLVNDDLDIMSRLPRNLAVSARNSESVFATKLFVSSTGPNSTFFTSGNGNLLTGNPALSITALQAAFTLLSKHRDTDGNPIVIDAAVLMVPPALEVVARNIINATQILAASGGGDGTENDQLTVANWMKNKVTLVVNPWLPVIDTTRGDTAWYLLQAPGGAGRPISEIGFLNGYDAPQLFMKSSDAIRVGGGLTSPMDGDFDTDSIQYKLRHVFGGTLLDTKSAVASNGSGS